MCIRDRYQRRVHGCEEKIFNCDKRQFRAACNSLTGRVYKIDFEDFRKRIWDPQSRKLLIQLVQPFWQYRQERKAQLTEIAYKNDVQKIDCNESRKIQQYIETFEDISKGGLEQKTDTKSPLTKKYASVKEINNDIYELCNASKILTNRNMEQKSRSLLAKTAVLSRDRDQQRKELVMETMQVQVYQNVGKQLEQQIQELSQEQQMEFQRKLEKEKSQQIKKFLTKHPDSNVVPFLKSKLKINETQQLKQGMKYTIGKIMNKTPDQILRGQVLNQLTTSMEKNEQMMIMHNESLIKQGISDLSNDIYKASGKNYYKLSKLNQLESNNKIINQLDEEYKKFKKQEDEKIVEAIKKSKNKKILLSNIKLFFNHKQKNGRPPGLNRPPTGKSQINKNQNYYSQANISQTEGVSSSIMVAKNTLDSGKRDQSQEFFSENQNLQSVLKNKQELTQNQDEDLEFNHESQRIQTDNSFEQNNSQKLKYYYFKNGIESNQSPEQKYYQEQSQLQSQTIDVNQSMREQEVKSMMKKCPNSLSKTIQSLQTADSIQAPISSLSFVKGLSGNNNQERDVQQSQNLRQISATVKVDMNHYSQLFRLRHKSNSQKQCTQESTNEIEKYMSQKKLEIVKVPQIYSQSLKCKSKKTAETKSQKDEIIENESSSL
eukprot:TRINITY_DN1931_c0_g2_i1.p1 TRINITY_DN1931_c0_g2~~TRINITY_DN1931_c0_g2_i1.p1  ORF type:complete len:659 (-),score=125.82 TRINITY_DN1931_c0_g2_i1:1636-3612(-)